MAFLVTNLVQNIYQILGQIAPQDSFDAIGGSATTFITGTSSSGFGLLDNPPEQDAYKGYLAIVARDAGGAGASPEGRWGIVSDYIDTTWTGTIATVTDAIAAGDKIRLAKQDKFPISHVITAINNGLEELGDLPSNADETLTTVSGQEQYSVPVAVKRGLKQVWIEYTSGFWTEVTDRRNELTGAGTSSRLFLPLTVTGLPIRLVYDGPHAVVSAYSSVINEYVAPRVATCVSILKLLEWYNRRDENQEPDSFFIGLETQYRRELLPAALMDNPIPEAIKTPRFFSRGSSYNRYRYGWRP